MSSSPSFRWQANPSLASDDSVSLRSDWRRDEVAALFALPFSDLLHLAQRALRAFWPPNEVQISTLLSIKTGRCPEDCAYCPQSAHYDSAVEPQRLLPLSETLESARAARDAGATRFCMGAAWRSPPERDMPAVAEMVRGVAALGLETCMTLGMLDERQAETLADAGLDYYNHNLDSSPEFYRTIITTRTYQDRLDTLERVRAAGIKLCCGGILGMGETRADRIGLLHMLASMSPHPESVPVNMLVRIEGTPLEDVEDMDELEFVRSIAVARVLMPDACVRLSAGREQMSDATQALAFLAGANSVFYGERLLTTANPAPNRDQALFERLGIRAAGADAPALDEAAAAE